MPFDSLMMFSEDQAITESAASTNILDLGAPSNNPVTGNAFPVDYGGADGISIEIAVTTAFAALTSLQVTLQGSTDGETFVDVASTVDIDLADLVAGYVFGFKALPLRLTYRYLQLYFTVTGDDETAGTVTAGFTSGIQTAGTF